MIILSSHCFKQELGFEQGGGLKHWLHRAMRLGRGNPVRKKCISLVTLIIIIFVIITIIIIIRIIIIIIIENIKHSHSNGEKACQTAPGT